ncbi:hypothetical protein FKP32DRAFT_615687 [Trametes sanguinea]|nr:hypothetical protein FKP32DRAFT_615687 [Trametes sanguinea]
MLLADWRVKNRGSWESGCLSHSVTGMRSIWVKSTRSFCQTVKLGRKSARSAAPAKRIPAITHTGRAAQGLLTFVHDRGMNWISLPRSRGPSLLRRASFGGRSVSSASRVKRCIDLLYVLRRLRMKVLGAAPCLGQWLEGPRTAEKDLGGRFTSPASKDIRVRRRQVLQASCSQRRATTPNSGQTSSHLLALQISTVQGRTQISGRKGYPSQHSLHVERPLDAWGL